MAQDHEELLLLIARWQREALERVKARNRGETQCQ
jgi:hypothetical protein